MASPVLAPSVPGPRWSEEVLLAHLPARGTAVVALSGGVDSAVVAHLLARTVGGGARAVTLTGPAISPAEVERATRVARHIGVPLAFVPVDPLALPEYRANPSNRCFFCRTVEMGGIRAWASALGSVRFFDGVHSDDLGEDRPGIRAMDSAGFEHPLLEARWGKREVRAYARAVGLPNAEQPSDACLASRVRHGQPLSALLLQRIARAEERVFRRGFRRVRVRVDGGSARIEVDPDEVARLLSEPLASELREEIGTLGFDPVTLDPDGYGVRRTV